MVNELGSQLARVCGVSINTPNLDSAVKNTITLARSGAPSAVFTLNLDHAVKLSRDAIFRASYMNADVITADGWPIAWLARRQNTAIERTTGADLFLPLVDAAAKAGLPVFLFGTSPGVLGRVGEKIAARTEGAIDIAGTFSPSTNFDPQGSEADTAIEKMRQSGAKLCFVALGAPKQEVFANYARGKGLTCCLVCIGAALDFVAGQQIRAPRFLRDNGLEWAWRLAINPRRLAKRYVESALMFAYLLLTEPMRHRLQKARS